MLEYSYVEHEKFIRSINNVLRCLFKEDNEEAKNIIDRSNHISKEFKDHMKLGETVTFHKQDKSNNEFK